MSGGIIVATASDLPGGAEGRVYSDCRLIIPAGERRAHSSAFPVGLIYRCVIYTAAARQTAGSNQFMAEASVHSATEPARSMIDWRIDWLWFMCLPTAFQAQCVCDSWQLIC